MAGGRQPGGSSLNHLAIMYAVLGATNEAILRARTRESLYQPVCDAAVEQGKFLTTAVIVPNPATGCFKVEAAAGAVADTLRRIQRPVAATGADEQGLIRSAFHRGVPAISNDFLTDERTRTWHAVAQAAGIASGAAVPMTGNGRITGVLLFYSDQKNAFDDAIINLIGRIAENITFALHKFEQEDERKLAEQALRTSEENYRSIIDSIEDAYYEVDLKGNLVRFNTALASHLGYPPAELMGMNNRDYMSPETSDAVFRAFNDIFHTGVSRRIQEWENIRKNGARVQVEGSIHLVRDARGKPVGFRGIVRDVTARRQMEQALREGEARFRALTNLSSDWFWETDAAFRVTRIDSRHQRKGLERVNFIGKSVWESGFGIEVEGGWDVCRAALESHSEVRDLVVHRVLPGGKPYYVCVNAEPIFDYHGRFTGYRGVSREITKQKIAEEHIQHLATHDDLTGLPNRVMFSQLANAAIKTAQRYKHDFAILFIDLDGFKSINDTLGHEAGDIFLKEIAVRLEQAVRASDVIARLGGDEFVVLVRELGEPSQAEKVAAKLLSAAASPVKIQGQRCQVTASIGIAVFPQDGETEQLLMKNADGAMYCAKKAGKNMFRFHSEKAGLS
ncbi:MAG: hypothetical protein JWQ23_3753 [Herminiimonas sp.]|nr:hypothetical protein [Herminiimonas sp.]